MCMWYRGTILNAGIGKKKEGMYITIVQKNLRQTTRLFI